MSQLEMESTRTKLLIVQAFSIISLITWLMVFLYYAYAVETANAILTSVGWVGT